MSQVRVGVVRIAAALVVVMAAGCTAGGEKDPAGLPDLHPGEVVMVVGRVDQGVSLFSMMGPTPAEDVDLRRGVEMAVSPEGVVFLLSEDGFIYEVVDGIVKPTEAVIEDFHQTPLIAMAFDDGDLVVAYGQRLVRTSPSTGRSVELPTENLGNLLADVAAGPGDSVYVADRSRSGVTRLEIDGSVTELPYPNRERCPGLEGPGHRPRPDRLAVDSAGRVVVADANCGLVYRVHDDAIEVVAGGDGPEFGNCADEDVDLSGPLAVTAVPDGRILVAEWGCGSVWELAPDRDGEVLLGSGRVPIGATAMPAANATRQLIAELEADANGYVYGRTVDADVWRLRLESGSES